ncbi:MAG: hypothetical protein IJM38_03475 [Ruminococcus sp.]|nr:hypothetical protein [Ruminococcus sp.]
MKRKKQNWNYDPKVLKVPKDKANRNYRIIFWVILGSALLILTLGLLFILKLQKDSSTIFYAIIYGTLMSITSIGMLRIFPYRDENDEKKNKFKLHAFTLGYSLLVTAATIIYILS